MFEEIYTRKQGQNIHNINKYNQTYALCTLVIFFVAAAICFSRLSYCKMKESCCKLSKERISNIANIVYSKTVESVEGKYHFGATLL